MNNRSNPIFDRYADLDLTDAKPVAEVPALAKLQAAHGGKSRITIQLDNTTLAVFKARAEMTGGNYQTMMNEALRQHAEGLTLADVVRDTIRQELHHARTPGSPCSPVSAGCMHPNRYRHARAPG